MRRSSAPSRRTEFKPVKSNLEILSMLKVAPALEQPSVNISKVEPPQPPPLARSSDLPPTLETISDLPPTHRQSLVPTAMSMEPRAGRQNPGGDK